MTIVVGDLTRSLVYCVVFVPFGFFVFWLGMDREKTLYIVFWGVLKNVIIYPNIFMIA